MSNRQAIARIFEIDVADDASLADMRTTYVEAYLQPYMEGNNVSEARAKAALADIFDANADVKALAADAEKRLQAYWASHPQDLKAALDAGLTDQAQYKDEILEKAGLQ